MSSTLKVYTRLLVTRLDGQVSVTFNSPVRPSYAQEAVSSVSAGLVGHALTQEWATELLSGLRKLALPAIQVEVQAAGWSVVVQLEGS